MRKSLGVLLVCGCVWFAASCGGGGSSSPVSTPAPPTVSVPGQVTGLKAVWNGNAVDRSMNSFNHYALGAVVDWLHRSVAVLAPAETRCCVVVTAT